MTENNAQKQTISEPTNKSGMLRWLPWAILGILVVGGAYLYSRSNCCPRNGYLCCPCWACSLPSYPEKPELPLTDPPRP